MDVHLLVYDLSGGLARQLSGQILGIQLDAIYHTSIELQGKEFVYDGGILSIKPGSSHLGKPLQRLHLGTTDLPMDVIEEYLDSLRSIFTFQNYDLFRHNCNNFSDSFANFLLGKGIPEHIVNMPQAVLDTPMGRMLMPHLTQGVAASRQNGSVLGLEQSAQSATPKGSFQPSQNMVYVTSDSSQLQVLLDSAKDSGATVFFTSATCPPCKQLYPLFDELAQEHGQKVKFIKVDISMPMARAAATKYSIRATPTFVTFLKGQEDQRWSGADPGRLRGSVQRLALMAFPLHLHETLNLPTLHVASPEPVLYRKIPPMQKLLDKMGTDRATTQRVQALVKFIERRTEDGPQNVLLPELDDIARLIQDFVHTMPSATAFTIVELFRCFLLDPRASAYFAEERGYKTLLSVIELASENKDCPYSLRLVMLHMACNYFSTPLFKQAVVQDQILFTSLTQLVSSSFLDDTHNNTRVAAASLLYNIAIADRQSLDKDPSAGLPMDEKVELAAAVLEAIGQEESSVEALQGMLTALGHLTYKTDLDGDLAELLRAMDAEGTILAKKKLFPKERLFDEVGKELIGKGLRRR